jgi:hypothetical protein
MSVTWAPRARMAVNAAWPGVSMKVMTWPFCDGLVGADVLGDATRLAGCHILLANRVEQAGLAVVDVAENGHDRRTRQKVRRVVRLFFFFDSECGEILFDDFFAGVEAAIHRDDRGRFVVNRLIQGGHNAVRHQALNYINWGDTEKVTEFFYRQCRRDGDWPGS